MLLVQYLWNWWQDRTPIGATTSKLLAMPVAPRMLALTGNRQERALSLPSIKYRAEITTIPHQGPWRRGGPAPLQRAFPRGASAAVRVSASPGIIRRHSRTRLRGQSAPQLLLDPARASKQNLCPAKPSTRNIVPPYGAAGASGSERMTRLQNTAANNPRRPTRTL